VRRHSHPKDALRRRLPLLSLALPVFAAITICCSNSIATAASPPTANDGCSRSVICLSGTWSGTYGGAYHGTFTLHWTQSGSKLSGTIKLSNPNSEPSIKGHVQGSTITFGTVGSEAITYSGSVSGKSMSGKYQTPGGGGSWGAHKTS
jgi:hypothetical protein